jgi:hypothetical protein
MATILGLVAAVVWRNEIKRRAQVDDFMGWARGEIKDHNTRATTRAGIVKGVASTLGLLAAIAAVIVAILQIK